MDAFVNVITTLSGFKNTEAKRKCVDAAISRLGAVLAIYDVVIYDILAVYDVVMYDWVSRMVRIVELRLFCGILRMWSC